jgi:hypothetical protein
MTCIIEITTLGRDSIAFYGIIMNKPLAVTVWPACGQLNINLYPAVEAAPRSVSPVPIGCGPANHYWTGITSIAREGSLADHCTEVSTQFFPAHPPSLLITCNCFCSQPHPIQEINSQIASHHVVHFLTCREKN